MDTTERLFRVGLRYSTRTYTSRQGRTPGSAPQFHLLLQQTEKPSQAITRSRNTRYSLIPCPTRLPRSYQSIQWFLQRFWVDSPSARNFVVSGSGKHY